MAFDFHLLNVDDSYDNSTVNLKRKYEIRFIFSCHIFLILTVINVIYNKERIEFM